MLPLSKRARPLTLTTRRSRSHRIGMVETRIAIEVGIAMIVARVSETEIMTDVVGTGGM